MSRKSLIFLLGLVLMLGCGVGAWVASAGEGAAGELRNPLFFSLQVEVQSKGEGEPLVSSGAWGAADFLFLRSEGGGRYRLGYDCWGAGGPLSGPFELKPGVPHSLEIEWPGLVAVGAGPAGPRKLSVKVDGVLRLEGMLGWHPAKPLYLALNPIGGSSCGPRLNGELRFAEGRLAGENVVPSVEHVRAWGRVHARRLVASVCIAGAVLGFWLLLRMLPAGTPPAGAPRRGFLRRHAVFLSCALPALLLFTWLITQGGFRLIAWESFGDYYDYQARSLLQGRLDVPPERIGAEAFVVDGRTYGYFGITPALLRLPFAATGLWFGQLARLLMLVDFAACLVFAYQLLRLLWRQGTGRGDEPPGWTTALLTLGAGLGSTLLYLSSRAFTYHEAVLCGAAFALASAWFSLRALEQPSWGNWSWALGLGVLAVNARAPSGLFAFVLIGLVAAWLLVQGARRPSVGPGAAGLILVGLLSLAGAFSFNAFNYLKFGNFAGCPLRQHIQYTPERLAHIDNREFHLSNIPLHLNSYLIGANFQFMRRFPYFIADNADTTKDFPRAKVDQMELTVGFPYAMPLLFLLATAGSLFALRSGSRLRVQTCLLWLAILPTTFSMFAAIAVIHRYTGDFCPFLITAAACGLVAIASRREPVSKRVLAVLVPLLAFSLFATLALTLRFQGDLIWGVPETVKARYQQWCR
jgi:hypothetical protein